jgi:6-phosphogluconolactonase (cycloisomerase 2 family)
MRFASRVISSAALSLSIALSTAAWAQSKTFVYTANTLDSSISIYTFNSHTGALVPSGDSPFKTDTPGYLASALDDKFLVVSGGTCPGCGLQTFSINHGNGDLKPAHAYGSIGVIAYSGTQIATDATGRTLYAEGEIPGSIHIAVLDPLRVNSDGSLTRLGNFFAFPPGTGFGSAQGALAVDPKGRWVFTVQPFNTEENLFAITRNSDGSLGSAVSTVNITQQKCENNIVLPHIAIDPQGKNLFISCDATPSTGFTGLQAYAINQETGALTRDNSFASHLTFEALSSDRNGWRIFATSEESNVVEVFHFDRETHTIATMNGGITYKTGKQPNGVVVDPKNKFVYVTNGSFCYPQQVAAGSCVNASSSNISGYSFNYAKGTLTPIPGSPFPSEAGTRGMIFVTVP